VHSDLFFMSATQLAGLLRARELTAVEVSDAFLRRIDDLNPETKSFVTVTHDAAMAAARRCDEEASRGRIVGPLHGVPVGIKDLFDFKAGVRNTFGSLPLADFVPTTTTPYIQRLEDAGAVVVGKTNAPEFGHKGITDNFVTGATSTPFDLSRNSGGSSGGSAAAVAAGLVPLAQGTDGGGSLRIPAAWCGVYGYKPSFGRVPDVARPDSSVHTNPFISAGPIARSVRDAGLMLSVMAGPHDRDPFSLPAEAQDYGLVAEDGLRGARVAFSPDLGGFPVDADVADVVATAIGGIEAAGASVEHVALKLPADQFELSALWLRLCGLLYGTLVDAVEGWGVNLMRDHADELTPAFRAVVEEGRGLTVHDIRRDMILRTAVQDTVQETFDRFDFIVTPTLAISPVTNAPDGTTVGPSRINGVVVDPSIGWCLTYPFNFTGNPAASVPCGLTAAGLPVGMQVVGRRHADRAVLAASAALEVVAPWAYSYPGLLRL
jgi:Asp-tRNA(Asn)/Glu-tRNA(Gln) amidotransferase A subunit family amidase